MTEHHYDVVIVGSGAGGGTVAQALAPLARDGKKVLVLEQGPRFEDHEFTGAELEMAPALYDSGGGFLTADGSMTLAFGRAYGGSTVVYTGTSLVVPERVVRAWSVPGLKYDDLAARAERYKAENNVHLLPAEEINENNRLFVTGCEGAGYRAEQFPVNLEGCLGSSLCNLGCPNAAKQGTNRVQLPNAERSGVEVVTRSRVQRLESGGSVGGPDEHPAEGILHVDVSVRDPGAKGLPSEWPPGSHVVRARQVVLAAGSMGTPPLLLRSGFGQTHSHIGAGFTCHPALILVGEHDRDIAGHVGHPKSYFLDRAVEEGYVLETCMYFPFITAKSLTGFGAAHSKLMQAFPRLQMILVLACDHATPSNRIRVGRDGETVVRYAFTAEVVSRLARATRAAARIFFAAGARRVHAPLADPPLLERADSENLDRLIREKHFKPGKISVSAAHLMGGAGMGSSVADSVTDHRGRVHGVPWLRVADASLFPDSLEINPYLTIMALADRVAEGLLEDWRQ